MSERKGKPVPIARAVESFLQECGLARRVEQAAAVEAWAGVVGDQIAAVTRAVSVTPDGVLFVDVANHGWMTELSLMEPELKRALKSVEGCAAIRKIRFRLQR